jgi:hypothetical protein
MPLDVVSGPFGVLFIVLFVGLLVERLVGLLIVA